MARRTMLVLALAALVGAGCGDDDDNGEQQSRPAATTPATTATDATEAERDGAPADRDEGTEGAERAGSTSRQAFIRRADRICADVREEVAARGRKIAELAQRAARGKAGVKSYYRESAALARGSADAASEAVDELAAMPRPASRRDALERYLAAARDQVEYLADQADALARADQAEIARLNTVTARTGERVRAAAQAYGFKVCGGS